MNKTFRKRHDSVKLSPEEAARQGRAAKLAWERMPQPGLAVEFLNAHHAGLGGRPIDLAVRSAEGLSAVEEAILALRAATAAVEVTVAVLPHPLSKPGAL